MNEHSENLIQIPSPPLAFHLSLKVLQSNEKRICRLNILEILGYDQSSNGFQYTT